MIIKNTNKRLQTHSYKEANLSKVVLRIAQLARESTPFIMLLCCIWFAAVRRYLTLQATHALEILVLQFDLFESFSRTRQKRLRRNARVQAENAQLNNNSLIRRYVITGSQRASNYWWASVISLGGLAFLLTGFAAFLNKSLFFFNKSKSISFFPQGLIMCFYGSLGLLFGIYLWCTVFWGVGNGFNEFNKEQGFIRIFRWGLPGKDRRIDLIYKLEQIEGVRVELKEGVNPRRTIFLKFAANKAKDKDSNAFASLSKQKQVGASTLEKRNSLALGTNIPLTRIGQPIALEDIESEASELAQFLQVPLDSFYEQ